LVCANWTRLKVANGWGAGQLGVRLLARRRMSFCLRGRSWPRRPLSVFKVFKSIEFPAGVKPMRAHVVKSVSRLGLALLILAVGPGVARAQWSSISDPFPGHPINCHLLTDGTVLCQEYQSGQWHRLFPDINGSYANGKWDNPSGVLVMPNGTDNSG